MRPSAIERLVPYAVAKGSKCSINTTKKKTETHNLRPSAIERLVSYAVAKGSKCSINTTKKTKNKTETHNLRPSAIERLVPYGRLETSHVYLAHNVLDNPLLCAE